MSLQRSRGMEKSPILYASAVGSLMYAMIYTRPHIAQAVGVVSHFTGNLGKEHWNAIKRIHRYIKGTSSVALCFGGSEFIVRGHVDSDFASDIRENLLQAMCSHLQVELSWLSKLQTVADLSIIEAEYMAATQACKEAIWIQRLKEELKHKQQKIPMYCDS